MLNFRGFISSLVFISVFILFSIQVFAQTSLDKTKIILQEEKVTIPEIFEHIESKTSFKFSYNSSVISTEEIFTKNFQNQPLTFVLQYLGRHKQLAFEIENHTISVYARKPKQPLLTHNQQVVKEVFFLAGTVRAEDTNEVLPGVNVVIKGTNQGSTTDELGNYSILIQEDAILQFSSIGYKALSINVGQRKQLDINLESNLEQLNEVVVVGYGTVLKSDLTGAVASVSSEMIQDLPISSVDQGIQGMVPGVQVTQTSSAPGGGISIRIRGTNSVNSGNEPLYVIDGFPVYSDNKLSSAPSAGYPTTNAPHALSFLNPGDIESIEILKDASATAIYGSRGANGVVIISTKRGKEGEGTIDYSGYFGVQQIIHKIDMLNGKDWAEFHNEASLLDGTPEVYDGGRFPKPEEIGQGTDWQDEIFREAPMQNHQLSFNGGNENVKYYVSLNYFDQVGIVLGSGQKRGSIRTNLDFSPMERVKFGTSLVYSYMNNRYAQAESTNTGQKQGMIGSALFNTPYAPVYNQNHDFFSYRDVPIDASYRFQDNPVALGKISKDSETSKRFLVNVFGQVELLKKLYFKVSVGADVLHNNRNAYFPKFTRIGDLNGGYASQGYREVDTWLNENTLNYSNRIGVNHEIDVVAGFSYQEQVNSSSLTASKLFINGNPSNGNIGAGAQTETPSLDKTKWEIASWIGRINYTIAEKYLITITNRLDGSSRFGIGNKWAYFPAVAGAWRISDENFLKANNQISYLKLRSSFGITGNTEIPVYQSLARLNVKNYVIDNELVTGIAPISIANPDLKWETTQMFNVGFDAGFFNNRIMLTANYYNNHTKDLLFNAVIPASSGFARTFKNGGSLKNNGYEFGLDAYIFTGNFEWNTLINWSKNNNKIIEIGSSEPFNAENVSGGFNVQGSRVDAGISIGSFWGLVSNGIYNTPEEVAEDSWVGSNYLGNYRYKDVNNDGRLDDKDKTVIGNPMPNFIWSWNNNFKFKNFDLSVFINAIDGADIMNPHFVWLASQRPSNSNLLSFTTKNTWSPSNPNAEYGRATLGSNQTYEPSSRMIFDGSFIRLKNVTLGYNFPTRNEYIRNARIYVSGLNLFTRSNYWGYDPEVNSFGQNNLNQGVDTNAYPKARAIMVGVNLGF